jgi:hypothetical protein
MTMKRFVLFVAVKIKGFTRMFILSKIVKCEDYV